MDERIKNITAGMLQIAADAEGSFGNLSARELNWKPAEKSWSIAQCFDHLITTHSLYYPDFERLAGGGVMPTFWERASPLSGFFGRFLIRSLDPKNTKKMKTTAKAYPSASEIEADIIERFCEHQQEMIGHVKKLAAGLDPVKTMVTSPLLRAVTYSLDDMFTFVPMHCRRHFDQAKRVTEMPGFPA